MQLYLNPIVIQKMASWALFSPLLFGYSLLSRANNELRASSQSVAGVKLLLSECNLLGLSVLLPFHRAGCFIQGGLYHPSAHCATTTQRPQRIKIMTAIFVSTTTIVGLPAYYYFIRNVHSSPSGWCIHKNAPSRSIELLASSEQHRCNKYCVVWKDGTTRL